VLVCYLDDSGGDPQNRIITIAGYIAKAEAWEAFETEVEPIFQERKVSILHAKEMEDTDGDFKDWTVLNKQAFVAQICRCLSRHVLLGVGMGTVKDSYQIRAQERAPKRTVTPYTFTFNALVDYLLRSIFIGKRVREEGIAFILESGNKYNSEAELEFHWWKKNFPEIENVLKSISFVSKRSCRAIQVADLLAFYARRDNQALEKAKREGKNNYGSETMIKIISEKIPHWGFVANEFWGRQQPV
jgi:hypothetical protein